MKAQSLKNAILQLAVQGKLVPQNPQDEPASELLKKIKAEKTKLVKEEKIKAEKPLAPINDEEKPFDIPDSWEWVRLGDLCHKLTDGTHSTPKYTESGVPFLSVKDMSSGKLNFSDTRFISEEEHQELYKRCNAEKGDLLLTKVGTTGVPIIVDTDVEFSLFVSVALLKMNWELNNAEFLCHWIKSPLVYQQAQRNTKGVGNQNWVMRDIGNTIIPLPPFAEQQRIVEKIEHLMPLVERYDSYEKELSALEAKFPQDLKKSVLQFAVQGRLVPQDDTDEPASELLKKIKAEKATLIKEKKIKAEKLLTPITDEEKPFDIPDSWEWARLDELCAYIQRGKSPKYSDVRKIPVIAQKCNQWEGFSIEKAKFVDPDSINGYVEERMLQDCDLMWNSTGIGTLGRMAMYETRLNPYGVAVADSHVTVIRPFGGFVLSVYLLKYFSSPFVQNVIEDKSEGSTKQKELSTSTIKNYIVPIPPLAEQQRIVEKVEQLLALCDVLADENKLKQYQLPKRLAKVIEFTPVETAEEHEHLIMVPRNRTI